MRKLLLFISVLFCVILPLALTACGTDADADTETGKGPGNTEPPDNAMNGPVLVVYFSWSPSSNTERMANYIAQKVPATVYEIEPLAAYPTEYTPTTQVALQERDNNARPAIKNPLDSIAEYETIFIGYPIWWWTAPMIIGTFLESYDLTGKNIYPFAQGESMIESQFDTSMEFVRDHAVGATVHDGLFAEPSDTDAIDEYLQTIRGSTPAAPTPGTAQTVYLWEESKTPALRQNVNNADPADFRPSLEYRPVQAGAAVKGAVVLCAGGAFAFRGNAGDTYPTANRLTALGYQCFVVQYRLRPYTQAESALDLARAVRYVRYHASEYGIDEKDIAVVGYSAGGILGGELALNWKGTVSPALLDTNYVPDTLDRVSADASAIAHIYSFYGVLSVSNNNVETLRQGNLPPTFYAYGTEDPFYRQFIQNANAVREAGVTVEEHVYQGQPHGFGAGNANSNWIPPFDDFLTTIFANN